MPEHLTFSLAALMAFYNGSEIRDQALIGHRGSEEYRIMDDASVLHFFAKYSGKTSAEYVASVLANKEFWGEDLSLIPGVSEVVTKDLELIRRLGMRRAMEEIFRR